MGRKKLIRKLVIPAAIIFVVSILVLIIQIPYRNSQAEKREENLLQWSDRAHVPGRDGRRPAAWIAGSEDLLTENP